MSFFNNIAGSAIQYAASFTGAGLLISEPSEHSYAVWALVITSAFGLAKQIIDARTARKNAEQAHRFALEDRAALQVNTAKTVALSAQLEDATKTVNENVNAVGDAAKVALDAANHVNEKIAKIAALAVPVAQDTNATAHRIEDKL